MTDREQPRFEKRVTELPDGRILIYYDFEAPAAPAEPPSSRGREGDGATAKEA